MKKKRIKKSLLKCNWTIRMRLPRCKMRLKKKLLAFSRRLHARRRKTRYMHKVRCLRINRRSLLLALRLLWKTPISPSNSRFPRLCAKCLLKLKLFFFQAEDGIRDWSVTGVQTCALPISPASWSVAEAAALHDAGALLAAPRNAEGFGVRQSSAAFARNLRSARRF